jgi:hypothetical protein
MAEQLVLEDYQHFVPELDRLIREQGSASPW